MARPKSEDKRHAILIAAARLIVAQGLGAPTAAIAKLAGISNGSLFTYFATKADLFNKLYLELKIEMAGAALEGLSKEASLRDQAFHMWGHWMRWAVANPEKRHAMKQLAVSEEITPETRAAVHQIMAPLFAIVEKVRSQGALKDAPPNFAGAVMNSLAETTMDFMIQNPADSDGHCAAGFEAYWRAMS
jgi:AcrR family transcriptional regulator